MALRVNAVTLESEDLHKLLKMDDGQMRFWLSSLYKRLETRSEDA